MISMKLIGVVLGSLCSFAVMAQERMQYLFDRNVWMSSENAASFTTYADSSFSVATISFIRADGAWRDFSDSDSRGELDAQVKSYARLWPTVMMYGGGSYGNVILRNAQGSMLWDDGDVKPFDLVDDSLNNAGKKLLEIVQLDGAVGWQATPVFSLGGKVNYRSGTFVKYKDLRHSNTYMRLNATGSLFLSSLFSGHLNVGLTFTYRRRIESLAFKTYGTNDREFCTLIDYAGLTGVVEYFGGNGFTDSSREIPLFSRHLGGGVQASWQWDDVQLYGFVQYLAHDGYYGKQSQYSVSYAQWNGSDLRYGTRLSWNGRQSLHALEISVGSVSLSAMRNVYRRECDVNNNSVYYYRYNTPTKMNDKLHTDLHVSYTWCNEPVGDMYRWRLAAGVDVAHIDQTAYVFPFYRRQDIIVRKPYVSALRLFDVGGGRYFTTTLDVRLQWGSGALHRDGLLSSVTSESVSVDEQSTYLRLHYDYQTKRCATCRVGATYQFMVSRLAPYFSVVGSHTHGAHSDYIGGATRQEYTLSLGCRF